MTLIFQVAAILFIGALLRTGFQTVYPEVTIDGTLTSLFAITAVVTVAVLSFLIQIRKKSD
jgi:hypothetical protein